MIIMDTCALVWDALNPKKLTKKATTAIQQADKNHELIISDISIWEVAMLIKKGRLAVDADPAQLMNLYLQSRNISVQSITPAIAELSVHFGPEMNADPADRMIAATAIIEHAQLVTADQNLIKNEMLDTIW